MKKRQRQKRRTSWITIIIVFAVLFIIGMFVRSVFTDSERILPHTLEKEPAFNAYEHPVVIDKAEYPELAASEKSLSESYMAILKSYTDRFKEYSYECLSPPTVSRVSFTYLTPKQDIYLIRSNCRISGEPSPYSSMPNLLFSVRPEGVVMLYWKNVPEHFAELFENLESLDQAKEYSEQYVDRLSQDFDTALNHSVFSSHLLPTKFKEGCPSVSAAPVLNSTVSKSRDGFVYEGLQIQAEGKARVYYIKYNITAAGQVVKDTENMIAFCREWGIVY